MTQFDRRAPRPTTGSRQLERRAAHRTSRDARTRRSFDGVVASYIREIAAAGEISRERARQPARG
jgi:hypothetical protein